MKFVVRCAAAFLGAQLAMAGAARAEYPEKTIRQIFERDGLDSVGNSLAEAKKFVAGEIGKWAQIVREKGLQMQ